MKRFCAGCGNLITEKEYDYSVEACAFLHNSPDCLLNFAHEYLMVETRKVVRD